MTQSHSQNPDQYLILHKVRGEPQFDVAEKTLIGDEEGWVLCTCGHRAYPFWHTKLDEWDWWEHSGAEKAVKELPDDWPDHYEQPGLAPTSNFNIFDVISAIVPKMKRRI